MRRGTRAVVALAAAGLLGACGLPTPKGVQSAGEISTEQRPKDIQVLPADPQPGDSAAATVRGFLNAQASPDDDYAVARRFLADEALRSWDPHAGVSVLESQPVVDLAEPAEGASTAEASLGASVIGTVAADGWSQRQQARSMTLDYDLVRVNDSWRISQVGPTGLTLTQSARDRSFKPVSAFFLSRGPGATHLVPDLVRVPQDGELARHLVDQVMQVGPSAGLATSVRTAVPVGARALSVQQVGGSVTVDLSAAVGDLDDQARQDLSAQLLWTLRLGLDDFSELRLLVDGDPLEVAGDDGPQGRGRWDDLDPTVPDSRSDALAVGTGGRAFAIGADDDRNPLVLDDAQGQVRELVQQPGGRQLAVLTVPPGSADGSPRRTLSVGLPQGTLTPVVEDEPLVSPTWGDGAYGVWALRGGQDPAVVLVDPTAAAGEREREVEVDAGLDLRETSVLRVSPDGSRVALVDGSGRLRIGRVDVSLGRPRLVDLREPLIVPETLASAQRETFRDVSWTTAVGDDRVGGLGLLAVRTSTPDEFPRPLVQLDVDGVAQTQSILNTGTDSDAKQVTAQGDQVLVAFRLTSTTRWQLYRRAGTTSYELVSGAEVSYPRFPG